MHNNNLIGKNLHQVIKRNETGISKYLKVIERMYYATNPIPFNSNYINAKNI